MGTKIAGVLPMTNPMMSASQNQRGRSATTLAFDYSLPNSSSDKTLILFIGDLSVFPPLLPGSYIILR
jgi:hypothetical protein